MKKTTAAFGLLISLAACSTDQPPMAVATSAPVQKIYLNVQSIGLADRSSLQTANSPYNTNRFNPTIGASIKDWAKDHLQAAGTAGQAVVIIKDASLVSTPMAMESGMGTWFTRQQGVKYTGKADVTIEANNGSNFATAEATAMRSVTLPENPTEIEKQDAYYKLHQGLMRDLSNNLQSAIETHMSTFMTSNPSYGGSAAPMGGSGVTVTPLSTPSAMDTGMDNATQGM